MENPHMIRSLLAPFQDEYISMKHFDETFPVKFFKKYFIKCQKVKIIVYLCLELPPKNCNHRS